MKKLVLTIFFLLSYFSLVYSSDSTLTRRYNFNIDLRLGYVANYWHPDGLGPFEVDDYGGSLLYGEIAVNHPLLFINEAFDIIQIPKLRIETNYGYKEETGIWISPIPESLAKNPYLKTSSWFTFFDFISFQYQREKFEANISDPSIWQNPGEPQQLFYLKQVENTIDELEIGLMGTGTDEFEDFLVTIGYYYMKMKWPFMRIADNEYQDYYFTDEILTFHSAYLSIIADPHYANWPIYSEITLAVGGQTGLEIRMKYEKMLAERLRFGVDFNFSRRSLSYSDDDSDLYRIQNNGITDTRMKITIFTAFRLFGSK